MTTILTVTAIITTIAIESARKEITAKTRATIIGITTTARATTITIARTATKTTANRAVRTMLQQ